MRYRIVRFASGFEVQNLTKETSEIVYDGQIITYRDSNPIVAMIGQSMLKISEDTSDAAIIMAIEREIND